MIPAYLHFALHDRRISSGVFRFYVGLLEELTPVTFVPVKQRALAYRIGVTTFVVSRRLGLLLELGYLERDRNAHDRRQFLYRLADPRTRSLHGPHLIAAN